MGGQKCITDYQEVRKTFARALGRKKGGGAGKEREGLYY